MSEHSPTLQLPYILPSQAQKHVTHNQALGVLDAVVQTSVLDTSLTTPPSGPAQGDCYIIANGATGAWAGADSGLAAWQDDTWVILQPQTGWRVWDQVAGAMLVFDGSQWAPMTQSLQNMEYVGVNTTADATNRLAVKSDATLLSHDGSGHQLKINKAAEPDTASLVFQSNWVGKIEAGLTGNNDFSVNYSSDGVTWDTGVALSATTGFFGIGTDSPIRELHVAGDQSYLRIEDSVGLAGGTATSVIEFHDATNQMGWIGFSAGSEHFHLRNRNAAGDIRMVGGTNFVISASGRVGIGTVSPSAMLHVTGDIKCSTLTETSDRRMKTNIAEPAQTGDIIDKIRVVQYDWVEENGHVPYGVLAQELAEVLPDAVLQGDNTDTVNEGTLQWGVRQAPLVAMLIQEVQSLRARVARLEAA